MAIEIKAIPTLFGEEATRFRQIMEKNEKRFDSHPRQDVKDTPMYKLMKQMLERSRMNY